MGVEEAREEAPGQQRERFQEVAEAVARREPFAEAAVEVAPRVEAVDEFEVVQDRLRHAGGAHDAQPRHIARQAAAEKVACAAGRRQQRVVVEEDETFGEPLEAAEVELDDVRVEGGQPLGGDVVRVADDAELRVGAVEPGGQVPPRDEVDAPYPRGEPLRAAEPVAQQPPVAVTLFGGIGAVGGRRACRGSCGGGEYGGGTDCRG